MLTPDQTVPVADDHPIEIRFLEPQEAPRLIECVRRSYGDSYDVGWVYEPEEIAKRIREGRYRSLVGTSDSEIVGHIGLTLDSSDTKVGESGQAMVDPRFRGHHLFSSLKRHLAHWCTGQGMLGIFSEATAAHPYSQKANLDLKATETGVLLDYIPATVHYAGIAREANEHRISAVLFYLMTNPGHERPIYVPPHHRRMVGRILAEGGLRGAVEHDAPGKPHEGSTDLHTEVNTEHSTATITIHRYGVDLLESVRTLLEAYRRQGLAGVYLDLPLESPETAWVEDTLEQLGFFFGGVFPNRRIEGDVLRLQFLNDPEVSASEVRTASEFGKELLDYVMKERSRTL